MILRLSSILIVLLALVATGSARADGPEAQAAGSGRGGERSPFEDAWLVPGDVTLYVHVERAAQLREALADRPLAAAFRRLFAVGETARAWSALATQAGTDETTLFDTWLGGRCTLVLRRGEDTTTDWALLTTVALEEARPTLRRLRVRHALPRPGVSMAHLPEQDLRLAMDDGRILVGPRTPGRLFDEILPRLAGDDGREGAPATRLADHPGLERARGLGEASVGVFVRNPGLAGGWSVAVADLAGDRLDIRYAGRFERSPWSRPPTEVEWDPAPLEAFEEAALVAFIEPTDIGPGQFEQFTMAATGEPLLSREMEANIGDCRIIAIGEVEGRREPHGADLLVPTGAVAIEIRDSTRAEKRLDAQIRRVARALAERVQALDPVDVAPLPPPAPPVWQPGETRHLGLEPMLDRIAPGHPIVGSMSLNWGVASSEAGSYYVVATHPEHLGQTLAALRSARPRAAGQDRPGRGRWTSCGTMNGRRVSVHLRAYSDRPDLVAQPDETQREAFRDTMLVFSELAGGLHRCRWRLARPSVEEVDLEIHATLSPPESVDDDE